MARIFEHTIVVGDEDIDELGHASNIAYVKWVQDVAVLHSTAVGFDVDAYRRMGAIFVIKRHEVDYLRSAMKGDRLRLRTFIATVNAASCRRSTEIVRESDEITLAKAETQWVFIDIVTGRPRRIEDEVRTAFLGAEAHAVPRERRQRRSS